MPGLRGYTPNPSADAMSVPLYIVEKYGEWRMEMHEDYMIFIDYYEEMAEIVFI
jgi:hypothetical protein